MIVTTRRVDQLQAECDKAGVDYDPEWGRLELMDALRAKLGMFDADTELDPMKAKDLKHEIDWTRSPLDGRYDGIKKYLSDKWVAEPKLDGCRLRMVMGLNANSIVTGRRSVRTYAYTQRTDNFPHLRDSVVPELAGVILDGEIIAPSPKIQSHTGVWTNSLLNASVALCNANPAGSVATQRRFGRAQFWVFDVLTSNVDGEVGDLADKPYWYRRMYLEQVVELLRQRFPECEVRLVPSLPATVATIEACLEKGFEGAMLKSVDGPYQPGKRSAHWLKVKAFSTADAFVCGFAPGENANSGKVGSLDLAVLEELPAGEFPDVDSDFERGGKWFRARPVAQVGNLTADLRDSMTAEDGSLRKEWYGRVVEFMAQGIGKNGRARHAHLVRLRPDKDEFGCTADQLDVFPAV